MANFEQNVRAFRGKKDNILPVTTRLSSKGQIVIPQAIRERHQFRAGDELVIEERDNEIVLKKARRKRRKTLVQWMLDCPVSDFNPWK
jgi:AbrB family looped-hinge helix DNA binding protein